MSNSLNSKEKCLFCGRESVFMCVHACAKDEREIETLRSITEADLFYENICKKLFFFFQQEEIYMNLFSWHRTYAG